MARPRRAGLGASIFLTVGPEVPLRLCGSYRFAYPSLKAGRAGIFSGDIVMQS